MKLYNNNLSPFSARCRLLIYIKGLDIGFVDPFADMAPEAWKALTPLGKVPALALDDGTVLPESETICEYLNEVYPDPPLLPEDAADRAHVRLLSRIGDLYLLEPLGTLFGNIDPSTRDADDVKQGFDDLEKALGWLSHYLDGSPYAACGRLTLADCTLVPILFFVRRIPDFFGRRGCLLDNHPKAAAYWKGIFDEPVVGRVYEEMDAALKQMR